eukprot:g41976.t1
MAIVLPHNNTQYAWAWPRVGPAIQLAIERINRDGRLLRGCALTYKFKSSELDGRCADSLAPLLAVDLKLENDPDVFVGPGCIYATAPVARFASHWGLPLVTAGASAFGFSKTGDYSTVIRTGPVFTKLGEFTAQLHETFNWTSRAVLVFQDIKTDDRPFFFLSEGIYTTLKSEFTNLSVEGKAVDKDELDQAAIIDIIQFIKENARIGDDHNQPRARGTRIFHLSGGFAGKGQKCIECRSSQHSGKHSLGYRTENLSSAFQNFDSDAIYSL